ncbi:MAG: DNA-directed RNA polymerase subunit alpha [Waddliaceae bacterium]|nr:DNA-directed RNA polymerase subunit alpha [Waddliaceae bacterium]
MALKYGKFEMPLKISVDEDSAGNTFARFIAEPFEPGFGHTIGNSLRRMLLGSLEAPAIISVRIEGVPHEYMAVEGIVEDMTNVVLNLKGALLRKLPADGDNERFQNRIYTTTFEVTQEELDANDGKKAIQLRHVLTNSNYTIVNPDLHLFTVTKPMRKQIDLRIGIGRGYVAAERHELNDKIADEIIMDSSYSPVRLVSYKVENTRVGQDTDFDRLILEITTDGRITPQEALSFSAQIGIEHLKPFCGGDAFELVFEETQDGQNDDHDEMMAKLALRIDEIELSVRSTNCLSGASIETIAELVTIPERRMLEFRNFGKKSLNEIKAKLHELGLSLGMDLSRYGITQENVKEKLDEFCESRKGSKDLAVKE